MTPPAVHPLLMGIVRGGDPGALRGLTPAPEGWTRILDEATAHGLGPLLYRWLATAGHDLALPAELADRLARQVFGLAARSLLLADELTTILRLLEANGVRCAPLRGPALAERLYGDVTARPTGDLDLLVPRAEVPRVARLLESLGFEELDRRPGFAEAFSYTRVFLKDRHGWVIVEPHWTIVYPPFVDRLDMAGVWERCERGRVLGTETWLLGREALILNLGLHLAHPDGGAPLLWYYELDRILRQEARDVDWPRLRSQARATGVDGLLGEALGTVRALFRTPIPDHVAAGRTRPSPQAAADWLVPRLVRDADAHGREELALFLSLRGGRRRLRYALGLLFPSPRFMRLQYGVTGRARLAAAYLRRGGRLAWAVLHGMGRMLRSPSRA
jgi:hypothetical protein